MYKIQLKLLSVLLIVGTVTFTACKKDKSNTIVPTPKSCTLEVNNGVFDEIPNLDFEDWYQGTSAGVAQEKYNNPCPENFWATPNEGSGDLGLAKVPIVVFRVDGDEARTGYAAKLVTGMGELLGKKMLTAATIASGDFKVDIQNPLNTLRFGKKFTRKPKKVSGYYKFISVESDSASAYCYLTNAAGNDTIGFGRKIFHAEDTTNTYKKFEFDVKEYKNSGYPNVVHDRLVIYFSSSEAGDDFKGQEGNTLYIDDVEVEYYE